MVEAALESPEAARLVSQVVRSRLMEDTVTQLVDETAARLPQSEALWALIDEVAQSPAVTEAITSQGKGFADQVAGEVRKSSRRVDDRLERGAWRLLRRRQVPAEPPEPRPAP